MKSKSDFDDFDEDLDDILLSDDETIKKSKKTVNVSKKEVEVIKEINNDFQEIKTSVNPSSISKSKPPKVDIFDDDHDPLASIDTPHKPPKTAASSSIKTARSVLDSFLNPVSDSDLFLGKKSISEEPWQAGGYRPSVSQSGKRTVRFSQENPLEAAEIEGRPVTAPGTAKEAKLSRFVSRFEMEAETLPKQNESKFNSESDPNLLWTAISDDSPFIAATKLTNTEEEIDSGNKDGNTRLNAKQKLTDFLQTSSEDMLSLSAHRSHLGTLEHSPKNSSEEEITFNLRSSISEQNNHERRSSMQSDTFFERPRTGHGRSDSIDIDYGRRSSVQKDTLFEKPRMGHGRLDVPQAKSEIPRNNRSDADLQLKHLQSERDDLLYKLEGISKRSKEELEIVEKCYKNQMELLEDNMQRKEKRFKEEIEILCQQNKQKLQMLEEERIQMRSELSKREDDIETHKRQEISRMREQHQLELQSLRLKHEDMIERLRHARSEEDSTIRLAQPTTAQLQSVLTQVSNGAQDLAILKQQLLDQMKDQIKEKDFELKSKSDSLRELEEQLNIQKHENVKERERLQSLISKLDIQLKEQAKQSEEERWYLRQEQNKMSAMQGSLEKEREQILKEKDANRESHEEFRAKMLEEQKLLFEQVYAEKRSLAEERARLTREVAKWSESSQISNVKKSQESAELEGIRSALAEERREIEAMKAQIVKERDEASFKISQMNSMSYDLKQKSEKLSQLERELEDKQAMLDSKERNSQQLSLGGEEALKKAAEMQQSYRDQLSTIQKQLTILTDKEKQIHKEEIELEKQRISLSKQEKPFVCIKCSNPLRDSSLGGSLNNLASNQVISKKGINVRIGNGYDQNMDDSLEFSHFVTSQLEEERLMHLIQRAADEDRDYLNNEQAYLRSLASDNGPHWRTYVNS